MTNAELIAALRCNGKAVEDCRADGCPYISAEGWCDESNKMARDAADALEATEKRIAELERQHGEQLTRNVMLVAQLPKEGEWIEANTRPRSAQFYCSVCHRTCYDIQPTRDKAWTKRCRYQFCPNCGARMKGERR